MRARLVLVIGLAGCRSLLGFDDLAPAGDDVPIDAADGPIDDNTPGCDSFSTQLDTCALSFQTPAQITINKIYNTDTHVLTDGDGSNPQVLPDGTQLDVVGKAGPINVWVVTTFAVDAGKTLRVVGSKPFGVVANGAIGIAGAVRANSLSGFSGAGHRSASECGSATPDAPGNHLGGAAGGGGGAFQGDGGRGQDSDANEGGATGATGGRAIEPPRGPIGGCPGGDGGSSTGTGAAASTGGAGGGAIYLVSAISITVPNAAAIDAGGQGGGAGNAVDGGGAGGGSGGMIVLEAPMLPIDGILAANGGGGGGGSGGSSAGSVGADALASTTIAAVGGQPGTAAGGEGTTGSVGATLAGTANTGLRPNGAGGGGGGGAGVISLIGVVPIGSGAKLSPPGVALPP